MDEQAGLATAGRDDDGALRALLVEEGDEFIEAAYMALLGRRPDAVGGPSYLRALRGGTPKLAVLYELSSSVESRRLGIELPGLAAAVAGEGGGEEAGAARAAAAIQSAEQLLVIEDPDLFLKMAYRVLLKRPADLAGVASYKERMREGTSRTRILHELFSSDERARLGTQLPGLPEAFRREGLALANGGAAEAEPVRPAQTLAQLAALRGAAFVECAYVTLLKRRPDEVELYRQAARLREGDSKLQLLDELAAAPAAAAAVRQLTGLAEALGRRRRARLPVIGALVRMLGDVEGDSALERRARANEERVAALEAALSEQVARFEQTGLRADTFAAQSMQAARELEGRIASLERSSAILRKLVARYMEDAPELDLPVSPGEPREPAVRLAVDARAEEILRDLRQPDR
jgi:hypothetical protein